MSRVVCVRGLPRGRSSRAFSAAHLLGALARNNSECVYVDLDSEGFLTACGAGCAGGACGAGCAAGAGCAGGACGAGCAAGAGCAGGARAAARARLAGDVQARSAALVYERAPPAPAAHPAHPAAHPAPPAHPARAPRGHWTLRLLADHAPHQELLLWFDEHVLAMITMPFLTLKNIKGKKNYVCHECGVQFEQPNPLKIHLFLSCSEYTPSRFWRKFFAKINEQTAPMNLSLNNITDKSNEQRLRRSPALRTTDAGVSAFRPYAGSTPPLPHLPPSPPLPLLPPSPPLPPLPHLPPLPLPLHAAATPAEIEAFATDWGKSREGHVCLYCGKLYSRKYGLKIHIRTHTGYKPLRCKYCLRAFGDPSNLNKHVRLHAQAQAHGHAQAHGPPAHACPLCGKSLVRRRDLERHLRTRHQHQILKTEHSPPP